MQSLPGRNTRAARKNVFSDLAGVVIHRIFRGILDGITSRFDILAEAAGRVAGTDCESGRHQRDQVNELQGFLLSTLAGYGLCVW